MKTYLKTLFIGLTLIGFTTCYAYDKKPKNTVTTKTEVNKTLHDKKFIKVALLLDTSNSMDGLIDQAKAQLWDLVNELSYAKCGTDKPQLKIALYEYGNDRLNGEEGYIRQVLPFSEDLDDISKELFSLTTNGGNEYCGQVIQTSLNQLRWGNNPDDLKLIFIAGNEPFTQGSVDYKRADVNANEKDVTINTIFCGNYDQGISTKWKDGAKLTDGDYMAINHNKKTVHIDSPFDDDILILNQKLNKTYIAYGKKGKHKVAEQARQDTNASSYGNANAVKRSISKSSHFYKNSSWDLVDAVALDKIDVEDIEKEALPSELKEKSTEDIKTYISTKQKERKEIQKKIQDLNVKRTKYLSEQTKTDKNNGLENAMSKAIKEQAKKKKYIWD
ncbi:hypothetical protein [Seonamhaeicola sp. ML3]|uniref:hypothetical protein n=1 Tax=Seonamhaeicola sp. ML3 TaxID=2937786 RepID=UPI00200E4D3E|nr:hypothetical protein [Seonamhaeicola sp. ML3]